MAEHDAKAKRRKRLAVAFRAALLGGVLLTMPTGAGPAEDVDARAMEIQKLLDAGRPAKGEELAREAVSFAETALGAEAAGTANIYRLLGDTLFDQKQFRDAEPFFRRALAIREKALGENHADTARSAGDLAVTLKSLSLFDEAETLYRRALDIRQKVFGPDHADVARSWFRLSRLFDAKGEYARAAEMMEEAVATGAKAFGAHDRTVVLWTGELAALHHDAGDRARAEPIYRDAIAAAETGFPTDDVDLANFRQGLANLLRQTERPGEAEALYLIVLPARERALGKDNAQIAATLEGLGRSREALDRLGDAVGPYQRALAIREKANGADSIEVATVLSRLGVVLMRLDRPEQGELQFRRLLTIRETLGGADSEGVAEAARWIANAAERQERSAEAETFFRRALAISERLDPDALMAGIDLLSLGLHYASQQRFREAGPLLERAIKIIDAAPEARANAAAARMALGFLKQSTGATDEAVALMEKALADMQEAVGKDHPDAADIMISLALLKVERGDHDEAERLVLAAEAIFRTKAPDDRALLRAGTLKGDIALARGQKSQALALYSDVLSRLQERYGTDSAETRSALGSVGAAEFALGNFQAAADAFERSAVLTEKIAAIDAEAAFSSRTGKLEDEAIAHAAIFDFLVKTYDRMADQQPEARGGFAEKAFASAQRVIESQAAEALAEMAARQAAGSSVLAELVRERQDLLDQWRHEDSKLTAARSLPSGERDAAMEAAVEASLQTADVRIQAIDVRLAREFPDFAELQKPGSLSFADVQAELAEDEVLLFFADTTRLGETDFETYLWAVPKMGSPRWVRLERGTGELSGAVRELRSLMGVGSDTRGAQKLGGPAEDRTDAVLTAAHEIYKATLAPVADMIAGKRLVIVPSKKLASLPFHLLVSKAPAENASDRYRDAAWLVHEHAITVLPSVASLVAATPMDPGAGDRTPYFGFANPLLTGRSGEDRRAFERTGCVPASGAETLVASAALPEIESLFRGATADVTAVRGLEPLPETTDEACAIAATLGAGEEALRLGAAATESEVKTLSETAELAKAKILHFATHGLVSGELNGLAEPAIVLTPPDEASARDDGLLTASEVATLKLDADWVILSACNTASGDGGGEALSGLARAFFYAGAKSLMVSHWPVNSDAAVSLATGAIGAIAADAHITRAEALRRAMLAEIARGGRHADPVNWAPFIQVGR